MKFPWQQRAEEARQRRIKAERELQQIRADWPMVHQQVASLQAHRELNGWTGIIVQLFTGSSRRKG